MSMLEAALAYAAKGWPVFPCQWKRDPPGAAKRKEKSPLVPGADKDGDGKAIPHTGGLWRATTDEAQIRAWWKKWPKALIGVPTGTKIGAFVVDLDPKGETVEEVEARLAAAVGDIPPCPRSRTQSGGIHLWFRLPLVGEIPKNSAKRLDNVDWRGEGGYVIVPPSVMSDGAAYRWIIDPAEFNLPAPTTKILDLVYQRDEFAPRAKAGASSSFEPSAAAAPIEDSDDVGDVAVRNYARAALDRIAGDVRNAKQGTRGHTLNAAAFAAAPFVLLGAISPREAVGALRDAADACGLTAVDGAAERDEKIRRGLEAGEASPDNVDRARSNLSRVRSDAVGRARRRSARSRAAAGPVEPPPPAGGDAPPASKPTPGTWKEPDCPVRFIGHRRRVYWVMTAKGELVDVAAAELKDRNIASLFGGDTEWLRDRFPTFDRHGDPTGDWSDRNAAYFIMRECEKQGLYDATMPVQQLGVWSEDGTPVDHCGTVLLTPQADGTWREERSGFRRGNVIWEYAPAKARPANEPATAEQGREFAEGFKHWLYATPAAWALLAGWGALGMLGAWHSWRPHLMLHGRPGGGKSGLLYYLKSGIGGQATEVKKNITEASLRAGLINSALAILLDEQNHEDAGDNPVKADLIIKWLRGMTDGEGAISERGSPDQVAKRSRVSGQAAVAGADAPDLRQADRSRFLVAQINPLVVEDPVTFEAKHKARLARAAALSPALRARMLFGTKRFLQALGLFKQHIMDLPAQPRVADTYGALLAGYWTLTRDRALTGDDANKLIDGVKAFIEEASRIDADESSGHDCLNALLSAPLELSAASKTIGEQLIDDPREGKLARVGVRYIGGATDGTIAIANRHQGLDRVFQGTRWSGGRWSRALRQLEGATASAEPLQFAGAKARATVLPLSYVPKSEGGGGNTGGAGGSGDT